jgi:hypothetical protein
MDMRGILSCSVHPNNRPAGSTPFSCAPEHIRQGRHLSQRSTLRPPQPFLRRPSRQRAHQPSNPPTRVQSLALTQVDASLPHLL